MSSDDAPKIRGANRGDAQGVAEVHVRSWQAAYRGLIDESFLQSLSIENRRAMWDELLSEERLGVLVVERDSSIVGFCSFGGSRDEDVDPKVVAEIMCLYLLPERWREGLGSALLNEAESSLAADGFRTVTVWVLDTNSRARNFYERCGFHFDGGTKTEHLKDGTALSEVRYRREL